MERQRQPVNYSSERRCRNDNNLNGEPSPGSGNARGGTGEVMRTLVDLELRNAACEALGYKFTESKWAESSVITRLYVVKPDGSRYGGWNAEFYKDGFNRVQFLPAIESDPAVSEPIFLEWCTKKALFFSLTNSSLDSEFKLTLFTYEDGSHWGVTGRTPSEVRALAIAMERAK